MYFFFFEVGSVAEGGVGASELVPKLSLTLFSGWKT